MSGKRSDEHTKASADNGGAMSGPSDAATSDCDHTSASILGGAIDRATNGLQHAGATIGRYRLLGALGQGGFGTVFLAEQQEPVRRLVALKILRLGMDSQQVVARFQAERQALAIMDHPGIAKVFDAGTTVEGRPYFVMELVEGRPITDWCDENRLAIDARIELFRQVCAAVQHAHQRGVIHRDLKPSNILVSTVDGKPLAKVIDFGIAKATSPEVGSTAVTEQQQVMGTFEYMSPEQAEAKLDIDTRTDVYSLAAVLYALLVGTTPLPRAGDVEAGILERVRTIRDDEPPRLGPRLLGEPMRDTIAANRATDAPRLAHRLRGELTWITLRGLEKDRARRYESPSALAADLARALRHDPVEAAPPSRAYRFRKFTRRHRPSLAAGTIAVALLAGTAVAMSVSAKRARDAETKALTRLGQFRDISNYFIEDVLNVATPKTPRERDTTIRQVLDDSAVTVENIRDPLVRSTVRQAIARTYRRLGLFETALPLFMTTLAERRTLPESDRAVAETLTDVGMCLTFLGRTDESPAYLDEALEMHRRLDGPRSKMVADTLSAIADRFQRIGDLPSAERTMRETIAVYREQDPARPVDLSSALFNLGLLLTNSRRDVEAVVVYRETLSLRESALGPDNYMTARAMDALGAVLGRSDEGRPEAERLVTGALSIRKKIFAPEDPIIASSCVGLGFLRFNGGKYDEALSAYEDAVRIYQARYGRDHEYVATAMQGAARSLDGARRHDEALPRHDTVVDILAKVQPADHWMLARARSLRGECLLALGERARAEADLTAAYAVLSTRMPERAIEAAKAMVALCEAEGRAEEADEWRRRAGQAREVTTTRRPSS